MIRDPGPIKNIGYSVTSRDIPTTQDEERGDAPNSTFVSKSLNNHPVLRFLGTAAATMGTAFVLSKITKQGGLRLAKTLQDQASINPEGFSSRAVKSLKSLRREIDELQGVSRTIDGVDPDQLDPYSNLVFESNGKLTTGQIVKTDRGQHYITPEEIRQAGRGTEYEPAAVWGLREEIQSRMVSSARRLPYELPALYIGQKALIDPIFGGRQDKQKVNWYNPVDVMTDFVKESTTALVTMMMPFEAGAAAAGNARRSLSNFRQSMGDITRSVGANDFKTRAAQKFVDLSDVLSEVGHDLSKIVNQGLKISAQTSGGIRAATTNYYTERQNLSEVLSSIRNTGAREAWKQSANKNVLKRAAEFGRNAAFGASERQYGYVDIIPGLRGLSPSISAGVKEFKRVGAGYDVISKAIDFDTALSKGVQKGVFTDQQDLMSTIKRIQSGYGNRMSRLASKIETHGGGGVGSGSFYSSEFYRMQEQSAYLGLLQKSIIRNSGREGDKEFVGLVNRFVNQVNVERSVTESTRKITIGKLPIFKQNALDDVLERFSSVENIDIPGGFITHDALKSSIDDATRVFEGREFQANLRRQAEKAWSSVQQNGIPAAASKILKTKKAPFEEFADLNNITNAKRDFLIKRSAQRLGIKLQHTDGRDVSNAVLAQKLGKRGLDIDNLSQLRSFLIREKQISSGIFSGGYNLLGLRPLTLDEGFDRGVFSHLSTDAQDIVRDIGKRVALQDPTTTASSVSVLRDMYITKSGNLLDFSGVRQSARNIYNFIGNDLKIPILNFNPLQMLGKGSFDEMSGRPPFQIVQGKIPQPFLSESDQAADFYLFYSGGRTKGQVMAFNREHVTGEYLSRQLEGFYRPLDRSSSEMLSRQARNAARPRGAKSLNELHAKRLDENGNLVNRSRIFELLRISPEAELRFRQAFDIDYEQPNSLLNLLDRFSKRKTDINNPSFLAKILPTQPVEVKGKLFKLNIQDDLVNVVDETGQEMISEGQLLTAFERFRKSTYRFGMPTKVKRAIEDRGIGTFYGERVTDLRSVQETEDFARKILKAADYDASLIRNKGFETDTFLMMSSRIRKALEESDLLSGSNIRAKSPTILTREDQLKDEIFRYLVQRDEILARAGANTTGKQFGNVFIEMNEAITAMAKDLPAGQIAEARAAAFSTLLNFSGFAANKGNLTHLEVKREALKTAAAIMRGNPDSAIPGVETLLNPFVSGSIHRVGELGKSGLVKQLLHPRLSTAEYQISDLSTDVLGSARGPGTDVLLVPTFGTVFGRNPFGAIASALGINTYNNPMGYSSASAAISHGVERLNKYFGTLGMQLDTSQYSSPMSLFASGMVGKRVLPIYGLGIGAMTVDRTIGGYVNEKDERGERVYSPFFIGAAVKGVGNVHALAAGLTPGGMTYEEKKEQLFEGEVPIRQGRFWPLGNTPFMGGKIMYYRPSIYRKIEAGGMFTSDTFGSPIERALFYTDISPLRPFDPYRFERKHYEDRPYPITGEYFSGPFGPLTPALNLTLGKILKPEVQMHEQEVAEGLARYAPAGQFGAYNAAAYISGGMVQGGVPGGPLGSGMPIPSGFGGGGGQAQTNTMLANRAGALNTAQVESRNTISNLNANYLQMAYGPTKISGIMPQRIVPSGPPLSVGNIQFQSQELGYRSQEMLGIYGFGIGSLRENFGYGDSDFAPQRSVLQAASKAYGTSRQFWDLNLGGLGDFPLMSGSQIGSLEFSEITRRFIPKERTNVNYINPIKNIMGQQYPFLPGPEYFTDFTTGDPFTKVQEGELRLPGVAYERLNRLRSDEYGRYGLLDQYKILGDVAPYSKQFRSLDKKIDQLVDNPSDRLYIEELRQRVASTQQRKDFEEYQYKYESAAEAGQHPFKFAIGRTAEYLAHRDTFINRKFINKQTAVEDWERNNVYGSTFPEWQRPYESFIEPMINKAADRNPLVAASTLAIAGTFFGRTPKGKFVMSALGSTVGLLTSGFDQAREAITGERFIPQTRKKELALEEYADILTYVKNTRLANMAEASGDRGAAYQFRSAAKRTMYGAPIEDIGSGKYGTDVESLSLAVPKRKREHFKAMINAPVEEREQILSTAGRLERRIYQAAWGMNVERRPDLVDYFARHELPDEHWEGWHPNTNMDAVKIKMGQSMGLQMSQMGYYPQQIQEANLANPSYPRFAQSNSGADIAYQLRSLMNGMGVAGTVTPVMNPFGSQQIDISAGVR